MLALLSNKKLIVHVAAELLVVGTVIFLFTQKYNKLQNQIRKLYEQLESQKEILNSHDQILQKLVSEKSTSLPVKNMQKPNHQQPRSNPQQISRPKTNNTFKEHSNLTTLPNIAEVEEDKLSETDSDIDSEIFEELSELEESVKEADKK